MFDRALQELQLSPAIPALLRENLLENRQFDTSLAAAIGKIDAAFRNLKSRRARHMVVMDYSFRAAAALKI